MPVFSFHMHFSIFFHLMACVSPVRIACKLYLIVHCTILVRMVLTIQKKLEEGLAIIYNGESVSHECVNSFTGLKKREKELQLSGNYIPSLFLCTTTQTKLN